MSYIKYMVNKDYFETIDTEEKAYWLGFILGDGYISDGSKQRYILEITLAAKDKNHLLKFLKCLNSEFSLHKTKRGMYRVTVCSKKMNNDLKRAGIAPRKSLTAKFPKVRKDLEIHVLRGLFDADGTICIHSKRIKRYPSWSLVGTRHCLNKSKEILGITNKICHDHSIWKIKKNGLPSVKLIYEKLYKGATIWLDRKKERFEEYYG